MTQEFLDQELYSGMGGPRYGYDSTSSSRELKPKGDLYSFLPSGWGSGVSVIESRRQQEMMEPIQKETELGQYHPGISGPHYNNAPVDYDSYDEDSYDEGEEFGDAHEEAFIQQDKVSQPPPSQTQSLVAPAVVQEKPQQNTTQNGAAKEVPDVKVKPTERPKSTPAALPRLKNTDRAPWVDDKYAASCIKCTRLFTTFRRRHHCRGCGKVFCGLCSDYFLLLPKEMGYEIPQRTCYACFKEFSSLDFSVDHDLFGPPGAPLVVLLHGATATRKSFGLQVPQMLWHYRVLLVDLPGHGSRDKDPFTIEAAIKVVKNLIAQYSTDGTAIVFGNSLGGYVAMALAGTDPDMVKGLIVVGAGTDSPTTDQLLGIPSIVGKTVPNRMLYKNWAWLHDAEVKDYLMEELFAYPGCFDKCLEDVKNALAGIKFASYLRKYTGPTLFVIGETDCRASMEGYLQASPNGNLQLIEGGNPLILVDERFYPRVNEVVLEFMDNVEALALKALKTEEERKAKEESQREAEGPFNPSTFIKGADWLFDKNAPPPDAKVEEFFRFAPVAEKKTEGSGGAPKEIELQGGVVKGPIHEDELVPGKEVELQNFTAYSRFAQAGDEEEEEEEGEEEEASADEDEGEEEGGMNEVREAEQPPVALQVEQAANEETEEEEEEGEEEEKNPYAALVATGGYQVAYGRTTVGVEAAGEAGDEEGSEEEEEEESEGEEQAGTTYAAYQPTNFFAQPGNMYYGGAATNMYSMAGQMGIPQGYGMFVPSMGQQPAGEFVVQQQGEEEEYSGEEEEYSEEEGEETAQGNVYS